MILVKVILLYNKQHSMNLSQNDSLCPPKINSEEEVASLMVYMLCPIFILGSSNNSKYNLNFPSNKMTTDKLFLKDIKQTAMFFIKYHLCELKLTKTLDVATSYLWMIFPNLIYNPQNMEFPLITFSKRFEDFMKPFNR